MTIKISWVERAIQRVMCRTIVLAVALASINRARADIALVDTVGQKGVPTITASGYDSSEPSSVVTISNFTVSATANVLVVLVEDKGASAINSEPATLAWGSQTILKAIAQDNSDTTRRGSSIYYLFNPTLGTNHITVAVANNPTDVEVTAYTLSGVDTSVAPKTQGVPVSGASAALNFNVPGVVAGSWAAVNATWAAASTDPVITGTGGTATTVSYIPRTASLSSVMAAGYIAGLSGGTVTFTATWTGSQKNNFAVAVFTPLMTAINLTAAAATPNPVMTGSNVVLSVTATSTGGTITNVTVNARALGGPAALPLILSAGNVYTNSVSAGQIAGGMLLPVSVQDDANHTLAGSLQVTVQNLADMQLDAYLKAFMLPPRSSDGRIYFAKSLADRSNETDGWKHAIDIQVVEDAYERTGDPQLRQLVNSLCQTWLLQSPPSWSGDGWNDDIGWFCCVLIRSYQMTGNTNFVGPAEDGFNMAFARGWDTNYNGGGIWELQPANTDNPHKEALSCDSLEQAALMIYQSTGDPNFLNRSLQIYNWVRINLFNPSTGAVYNGVKTNGVVDTGVNLYNAGTFVDCANLLHNITGQQVYYDDAHAAVEYVRNNKTSNGIFKGNSGNYTWAAEFARGLGHFVKDNHLWSTYYPWMQANANAAWNSRRMDYNVSWNDWTQPTPPTTNVTVGYGCDAMAMTQMTPATEPGLVNCTNQLHGTLIGSPGSWNNSGNTIARVFDSNLNTFFDAPDNSGDWVGLDFGVGVSNIIGQINYWPRIGYSGRMLGGVFQGDSSPAFPHPVTLFIIATAPPENDIITPQTITNKTAFRCVRYVGPANGACNVAELQFFSPNVSPSPLAPCFTVISLNGTTLSLSATNGTPSGSWTLLQSTDLALPFSQWQTNIIGTFDGSGNLSTDIANTVTNGREFYILKVQ